MIRRPSVIRASELAWFHRQAERLLRDGHVSALYAVARNHDTLHRHVILSRRDVPLWPHECDSDDDHACETSIVGGDELGGFSGIPELVTGYAPFALARRGAEGVEVTPLERPYAWAREDLIAPEIPPPVDWLADPDARSLYDMVCANVDSDEPRHVLADYLLERDDGHGIVIAFALARALDEDAYQRHEQLLRENGPRWLGPLLRVIPVGGAHFRRGFLWRAEICAPDAAMCVQVRGTPALGTVEQLRIIQPSPGFALDPSLASLREVAMLDRSGAYDLADNPAGWRIERLGLEVTQSSILRLVDAVLPRLQLLEITGDLSRLERLQDAAWWPGLRALTIVDDEPHLYFERAQRIAATGPIVSVNAKRRGWQISFTPGGEVRASMRDFDAHASRHHLRQLVGRHFPMRAVTLDPSPYFAPRPGDLG
ncbi:MAG: hypothetical protein KF773_31715 [Deltaproteobacteria bacterium]|nr:hypothetical protein [Deltaproteobacteria bacterium]